jgi:hypothetical protein
LRRGSQPFRRLLALIGVKEETKGYNVAFLWKSKRDILLIMWASLANHRVSTPVHTERSLGRADVAILLLLLALGSFQVATVQRVESFGADSSVYIVLAHNILETGRYEFNFRPHTVYPPAFPFLLAGISMLTGRESYGVFIRFMPVFGALALVTWYFVLRRTEGRVVAGVACLLVGTSAAFYQLVTQSVLSEAPFFFMSGLVFLFVRGLEQQDARGPSRFLLLTGLCLATAVAVLLRSVGIALGAALFAWGSIEIWRRGSVRFAPWRPALFAALFAFLGFFGWVGWSKHSEQREYTGQRMESYASALLTKDPYRPELGVASTRDLVLRVASNAPVQAAHIFALLTRVSYVMPTWNSPPVVITLALLLCGLVSYVFDGRRGLLAWYFLAYFTVYLFWPFDEGQRFMLPVSPLACVLIWRGLVVTVNLLRSRPTATLACISALAAVLAVATGATDRLPGMQARVSMVFWPLTTAVSIFLIILVERSGLARATSALDSMVACLAWRRSYMGVVGILLAAGLFQQAAIARTNLAPDPSKYLHYTAADCAAWLRTAGVGAVMTQQFAIIHRLSGRRTVSFPITSDPQLIVDTATREKVRYLVVNDGVKYEYFSPTEEERWRNIERAYPLMFQLVYRGPGYRVFEVKITTVER